MIVVIYKGKGREGTKQVPFTSKALAIKKAKDLYKKGYCNVKVSEISEKVLFIPGRTIWIKCDRNVIWKLNNTALDKDVIRILSDR